jgi:hypothetical protein
LLDTELGVVYWPECPGEIQYCVWPEQIGPDPYGMADEGLISYDQAQWRAGEGVWAITDFFEMLKFHFRELNFVPVGLGQVKDI